MLLDCEETYHKISNVNKNNTKKKVIICKETNEMIFVRGDLVVSVAPT